MRPLLLLPLLLCAKLQSSVAFVIEFRHDGSVSVTGGLHAGDSPVCPAHRLSASTASMQYRDTAYAVGLRHAGGPGPRASGLAVTEFADLFVALIDQESRFDPR